MLNLLLNSDIKTVPLSGGNTLEKCINLKENLAIFCYRSLVFSLDMGFKILTCGIIASKFLPSDHTLEVYE